MIKALQDNSWFWHLQISSVSVVARAELEEAGNAYQKQQKKLEGASVCDRRKGFQKKGQWCLGDVAASSTGGPEQGKGGPSLMKFVLRTLRGPLGGGAFRGPRSPTLIGETRCMKHTCLVSVGSIFKFWADVA